MPLRSLLSLLFFLLLAAALPARAGVTYTFAGGTVDGCTRNGTVYTCPALPLPNWDDKVVIGGGYTVQASGDVNFGYNQGLSMTGGATLKVSGNLNIGGINPPLLQINGANFIAGGQFAMGAQQQTIVANITAATMQLGTGSTSKITGTIVATGEIAVASYVTIVGPITGTKVTTNSPVYLTGNVNATESFFLASHSTIKGDIVSPTVDTNSPVTINGNVTATKSFTFASGSTMTGNVKSDVVRMYASNAVINGNVTATTSLTMGSADVVNGDVDTGELTLEASDSRVAGNATVNHATLYWAARVTDTIICRNGSTPGKCDCVTNNSGYEVRNIKTSGNGPYCEGKAQPLHHFLLKHPTSASICLPAKIEVTACADANCTTKYTGGDMSVVLAPGSQAIAIGADGVGSASVSMPSVGTAQLGLTRNGAAVATTCQYSTGGASNCALPVSDVGIALALDNAATAFYAGLDDSKGRVNLNVSAFRADAKTSACVPLFDDNSAQDIDFSFTYANPASGKQSLYIGGTAIAAGAQNKKTVRMTFAGGKASAKLSYADAGSLNLNAAYTGRGSSATASQALVAAPASFKVDLSALPTPHVAGSPFSVRVTALHSGGGVTENFGKEQTPVKVTLAGRDCAPAGSGKGLAVPGAPTAIGSGIQDFDYTKSVAGDQRPRMDEVGSIDVDAALASGYLGSPLKPTGSTYPGATAACGASGVYMPAYFKVENSIAQRAPWPRKLIGANTVNQYYADEPGIDLTVTAMNLRDAPTKLYAGAFARDVVLLPVSTARKELAPVPGAFALARKACNSGTGAPICVEDFTEGVATWQAGRFTFPVSPSAPASIRVRATELPKVAKDAVASSSAAPTDLLEPNIVVRSGRVRLASNFGNAGKQVDVAMTVEYWDGASWRRNFDDSATSLPLGALALSSAQLAPLGTANISSAQLDKNSATITFVRGLATLTLQPPAGSGSIALAANLGSTGADQACLGTHPASTPAKLPFLRAADKSCNPAGTDPSARATFGVFTPETKRIIHVREVFR